MKTEGLPAVVFHIAQMHDWNHGLQNGSYRVSSLENEGFIHFSTDHQLMRTANKYFQGKQNLVLLVIDPERLAAELRYEPIGDGQLFPHLYGELNLDAVTSVFPFEPENDGTFAWPEYLPKPAGES